MALFNVDDPKWTGGTAHVKADEYERPKGTLIDRVGGSIVSPTSPQGTAFQEMAPTAFGGKQYAGRRI